MILLYALMIFCCSIGILGLLLSREYIRKILCLALSYTSFLVLIVVLSYKSDKADQILELMFSVLIIFAINLTIGISITKNIAAATEQKPKFK